MATPLGTETVGLAWVLVTPQNAHRLHTDYSGSGCEALGLWHFRGAQGRLAVFEMLRKLAFQGSSCLHSPAVTEMAGIRDKVRLRLTR